MTTHQSTIKCYIEPMGPLKKKHCLPRARENAACVGLLTSEDDRMSEREKKSTGFMEEFTSQFGVHSETRSSNDWQRE